MQDGIMQRLKQHPLLSSLLFGTQEREIVFKHKDPYWGVGEDGNGDNKFGKMLQDIRDNRGAEIRNSVGFLI